MSRYLVLIVLLLLIGCQKYFVDTETQTVYDPCEASALPPEAFEALRVEYALTEAAIEKLDKVVSVAEKSSPALGLLDLVVTGLGTALITAFSVGTGLYRKHKKKVAQLDTRFGWVATGAEVVADALNEIKQTNPETWDVVGPIIKARREAKAKPTIMPNEIHTTTLLD